jgi:hypothetical protein
MNNKEIAKLYGLVIGMMRAEAENLNSLEIEYGIQIARNGGATGWYNHWYQESPDFLTKARKIYLADLKSYKTSVNKMR